MRPARIMVVAVITVASAGACRKKSVDGAGASPRTGVALLGFDGGIPDEDALRSGKRTGLAGDAPEIATEPLVRALIEGRTPWQRFVDPRLGVVELRRGSGDDSGADAYGRRCGAAAEQMLAAHAARIVADLARAELGYELSCSNVGLFVPDPDGAAPYAICSFDSQAAYAPGHDLLFMPDPQLGLRLVGITEIPGDDPQLDEFSAEIAKTGTLCP